MKTLIFFLLLSPIFFAQLETSSQDTSSQSTMSKIGETISSGIKISGELGSYGEGYSVSGRESRRPGQTGRLFFRPSISFFDNFSISFDIFLSTEGSAAQQQISTLSLHPVWGWSRWHIGDFSPELSKFTMNGINIRGGGVELNPGWFRFAAYGGQSQRATNVGAYGSMYSRHVVAGKIGIGSETSFFDINFVRSKDDIKSLPRDIFREIVTVPLTDTTSRIDTQFVGITPQENLVVGATSAFRLFNGAFRFKGEAVGSIFTKDLTSKKISQSDLSELPNGFDKIYAPRLSSSADYAYFIDLGLNLRVVNSRFSYTLIGPGYTSMGLPTLINDKKSYSGGLGLNLLNGALTLQGTYINQTDNLANQKKFTTDRNTYGLSTNIRPIQSVNVATSIMLNAMTNSSTNDTLKMNNLSTSFNTNVSWQVKAFGLQNTISTSFGEQLYEDKNILRKGNNVTSTNISLSLATVLNPQWNFSVGGIYNSVQIQQKANRATPGANFRISNRSLGNKLNSNFTYSISSSDASDVHSFTITSNYPLLESGSLALNFRSILFRGKGANGINFTELTTSLGYTYRF